MPFAIVPGGHRSRLPAQFTVTGVMSIISFAIVLGVGFWKHGLHFFSLFVPSGNPSPQALHCPDRVCLFLVRPFSLGLRPFVAVCRPHLLEVFGNFVVQASRRRADGYFISALCFVFVVGVSALELLVGAIQAFVFALWTSLYIKDAVHLH